MLIKPVACGCLIKQRRQPILAGNCRIGLRHWGGETIPLWNCAVDKGVFDHQFWLEVPSSCTCAWLWCESHSAASQGVQGARLCPYGWSYTCRSAWCSAAFSSVGHLRFCLNWEMLVGSLGPIPDTQRMAWFCILSRALMSFARWGSHISAPYSAHECTRLMYAVFFSSFGHLFKFLLRNPSRRLHLFVVLRMCSENLSDLWISMPR